MSTSMVPEPVIGIIGGSGLYEIEGLTDTNWQMVESPFGKPSDEFLFGTFNGLKVVFCPRHGRGHVTPPSEVNFRANIDALKRAGVTEIIAVSAVGSLREGLPPGKFVFVDQFIDNTFARQKSFFSRGLVSHVSMAEPVCDRMNSILAESATELGIDNVRGGTMLVMEGPQFSTKAESELFRSWGCDIICMTSMPEAKLAREAEMCYANVAMVTDYDCWHAGYDNVTVEQVISAVKENADKAVDLICAVLPKLAKRTTLCDRGCHTALDEAVQTAPDYRSAERLRNLGAITARFMSAEH
ncbi:MAG: S-methyl-5'-thioadenosine phosphorylase [Pseudomonadota bacterium]|nr:S-methyl-5'-thioadenosine phosphorylase [Pseudomonadota bacterium]